MKCVLVKTMLVLLLVLAFAHLPVLAAADVDRSAAYKDAIPLYNYDTEQPLAVQIKEIKRYQECLMLRISYASANGVRVPAVVFEP